MSDADTSREAPFDFDKLVQLVKLMETHGLTEVSLKRGDQKWTLRRGGQDLSGASSGTGQPNPGMTALERPASAAVEPRPASPPADGTITINSPTVGTFYSAPTPEDTPFVSVGTRVSPETVVCIVEAMKVFNQIPAEVNGTIVEVLAKNGDAVEFGQPMFRVRPG